jgi:hypothetical protein
VKIVLSILYFKLFINIFVLKTKNKRENVQTNYKAPIKRSFTITERNNISRFIYLIKLWENVFFFYYFLLFCKAIREVHILPDFSFLIWSS